MHESIVEVGRVAEREGIDADYARGGTTLWPATRRSSPARASWWRRSGGWSGPGGAQLLSKGEAEAIARATRVLGATFTPNCAVVHPLKLVRGLAERVEARGVSLFERTRATGLRRGELLTDHGSIRAEMVVRATEGYTASLRGERRRFVPLYSLMIATEPLPSSVWDESACGGARPSPTCGTCASTGSERRMTGSRSAAAGRRTTTVTDAAGLRPGRARARAAARGAGRPLPGGRPVRGHPPLGRRDRRAARLARSVGLDSLRGVAWGGGYVGDGVATANLAGRTLAQLITGRESDLTHLPWVGHRSRDWEPEPLRWLGVNGGRLLLTYADRAEARSGKPARSAKAFARLIGY